MINTVITAFVSFVSTNIDDIFILMLFWSQKNTVTKIRYVVIGQYLGVGTLVTISIFGGLGLSAISPKYVGLLGLIPIFLGIKTFIDDKKDIKENINKNESISCDSNKFEETYSNRINPIIMFIKKIINPTTIKVSGITLANGGDNIGVYVPLFSRMSLLEVLVTVIIFIFLIALWCYIGFKLTKHPLVQRSIERYNNVFVPIVFIWLGIFILV